MKFFVAILVLTLSILCIESRPSVEIEKQRLIEIPTDDTTKSHLKQQSDETKRIYDEIARINEALGYTKRAFSSKVTTSNSGHEGYFYPRASEQLHLPVFLRTPSASFNSGSGSRHLSKQIDGTVPSPFNQQTYFYPAPYLHLPLRDEPRQFRSEEEIEVEDTSDEGDDIYIYRTLPKSLTDPSFREDKMTKFKKTKKVTEDNIEMEDLLTVMTSDDMSEIEDVMDDESEEEPTTKVPRVHNDKYMMEDTLMDKLMKRGRTNSDKEKAELTQTTQVPVSSERPSNLKTFGIAGFGSANKIVAKKPVATGTTMAAHKITAAAQHETEKESVKAPNFGQLFQTPASLAIKDIMKEGGIVIQRLKVRKGGIAIAGPGGVATAGSGGTAIVGPGGLALTHPRGLSIAGPGARVVSIPEHIDLQKVALKATARMIPVEGMLVATGPIVYYNP